MVFTSGEAFPSSVKRCAKLVPKADNKARVQSNFFMRVLWGIKGECAVFLKGVELQNQKCFFRSVRRYG